MNLLSNILANLSIRFWANLLFLRRNILFLGILQTDAVSELVDAAWSTLEHEHRRPTATLLATATATAAAIAVAAYSNMTSPRIILVTQLCGGKHFKEKNYLMRLFYYQWLCWHNCTDHVAWIQKCKPIRRFVLTAVGVTTIKELRG